MHRNKSRLAIAASVIAAAMAAASATSAAPRVVASSKPVHALVAAVMGSLGEPVLLVAGAASPHSYAMKPSDAKAAHAAALLFRISESLEPFTGKLVKALPKSVTVVTLLDAPGLSLLDRRESGPFEHHQHRGHDHKAHKDRAEDERDPHIWLDPVNAAAMIDAIEAALSKADPASAGAYRTNAAAAKSKIAALADEIAATVKPAAGKPFIVLHDAYQYFERRFGLTAAGSIAVSPEAAPSAKRLSAIRKKIADTGAACLFAEPGMQPKVVQAVAEGTAARVALLDPEATQLPPGAGLYEALLRGLATAVAKCFAER